MAQILDTALGTSRVTPSIAQEPRGGLDQHGALHTPGIFLWQQRYLPDPQDFVIFKE